MRHLLAPILILFCLGCEDNLAPYKYRTPVTVTSGFYEGVQGEVYEHHWALNAAVVILTDDGRYLTIPICQLSLE